MLSNLYVKISELLGRYLSLCDMEETKVKNGKLRKVKLNQPSINLPVLYRASLFYQISYRDISCSEESE